MTDAISQELKEYGYSIKSRLIRDDFNGIDGNHVHLVTITYKGNSMECEFTSGCAHRHYRNGRPIKPYTTYGMTVCDKEQRLRSIPDSPSLEDVMYSLLADASIGRNGYSHEDFCEEFGYDPDSRKGFNMWVACVEQYSKLRKMGVDFDDLDGLFEEF